jgi:N-acetylmuramoyl-L-alanine amidase
MVRLRYYFCISALLLVLNTSCSSRVSDTPPPAPVAFIPSSAPLIANVPSIPEVKPLSPISSTLVILDAGHGGTDEGARVQSLLEKRITLTTTLLTKKSLEEMGYRVILTRSRDRYISLARRVSIANKTNATIFVSIHFNAARNNSVHGVEIHYCDGNERWRSRASRRLADCILFQVLDQTEAHSRGIKQNNFVVIRDTNMPAVLVEGGFMTNGDECSLLKSKEYLKKIAQGIAQGVDKYFRS